MSRPSPLADKIRPHLGRKRTIAEIATAIGSKRNAVYNTIRHQGWGDLVRYKNRVKSRGRVQDVYLQADVYEWLVKISPEGSRVDEMITSIVIDAYHDDMEKKE